MYIGFLICTQVLPVIIRFSTIVIQLSIGKIKICKMYKINTCSDYKAPCTADRTYAYWIVF